MTTDAQVRDATVRLFGLQLHDREWGRAAAPALVLLHGMTSNARAWDRFGAAMADRYRVLALDARGHGERDHADDDRGMTSPGVRAMIPGPRLRRPSRRQRCVGPAAACPRGVDAPCDAVRPRTEGAMAWGKHWEWRGFGVLPDPLRTSIDALPRTVAAPQVVVDQYLWVPGCTVNVKLRTDRASTLKLKRYLEQRADGLECWEENESESYAFPLATTVVQQVAAALRVTVADDLPRQTETPAALLALLRQAAPSVQVIAVRKERLQREWVWCDGPSSEPVIVDVAAIRAPEPIASVALEHPAADAVAAAAAALNLAAHLRRINYLEAIRVWATGERLVV
jgi:hypothetical protein